MSMEETNENPSMPYDLDVLKQALLTTEVALDLKERCAFGEKYVNYLKSTVKGAEKALVALQYTTKSALGLCQKFAELRLDTEKMPVNVKQEYDNLLSIIRREINSFEPKHVPDDDFEYKDLNLDQIAEKIRVLETKNRNSENNLQPNPSSSRSSKVPTVDINEKYPENLSRESLIDLNNVTNLPPVPEDIFTSFSNNNKPIRTSSLSSLKSMRKVKLFLQKAESSDDEDSSDNEEHDYSKLVYGDNDENKQFNCHSPSSKKLQLGNIKEEAQD